jgi:hypothetical protein
MNRKADGERLAVDLLEASLGLHIRPMQHAGNVNQKLQARATLRNLSGSSGNGAFIGHIKCQQVQPFALLLPKLGQALGDTSARRKNNVVRVGHERLDQREPLPGAGALNQRVHWLHRIRASDKRPQTKITRPNASGRRILPPLDRPDAPAMAALSER